MKKFFAAVIALALIASPGAVWAEDDNGNGNGPTNIQIRNRNQNNINIRNRNQNNIRNSNRNQNYNTNRNQNYNTNRNSNKNLNLNLNKNVNRNTNRQNQGQYQGQYQGQGQSQVGINTQKGINNSKQSVNIEGDSFKAYAPAPNVYAPALTSGNDVCMGSASVSASGGSGIIGLGFGFGKTYTDLNCVRLKNANALFMMGHKDAALALLANNDEVANALTAAGVKFATLKKVEVMKAVSAPETTVSGLDGDWGIDFELIDE